MSVSATAWIDAGDNPMWYCGIRILKVRIKRVKLNAYSIDGKFSWLFLQDGDACQSLIELGHRLK
jgi:hypothetical protein